MTNTKFGNGQDTCKICGQQLNDVKVLRLKINHISGSELVDVKYFVPLCDQHRGDGCLDIDIGWADVVSVDEMRSP